VIPSLREVPSQEFSDLTTPTIKLGIDRMIACKDRDKKIERKQATNRNLQREVYENSWVKPANPRFVSDLSLKRVCSLKQRLEHPLRQPMDFGKLYPQRMCLMTKESFQCPSSKCKNSFLMKPVIGARHCSFEVNKLAIDYLPRMRMDGPLGGWLNARPEESKVNGTQLPMRMHLFFANSINRPITIQVTPQNTDKFSNTDVRCSRNVFNLSKVSTSIRNV